MLAVILLLAGGGIRLVRSYGEAGSPGEGGGDVLANDSRW